MKQKLQITASVALAVALLGGLGGCASILPGNDLVVVRAEQTTAQAYTAMEQFKTYEYNNRATLEQVRPEVEHYANIIRRNEQKWLQSARAETQAYKHNRAGGHANLDTALAVLQEAIRQIGIYMAQAGAH